MVELVGCPYSNLNKLRHMAAVVVGMAEHMVELLLAEHTGCKQQVVLDQRRYKSADQAGVEGSGLAGIQSVIQPFALSKLCTQGSLAWRIACIHERSIFVWTMKS